MCPIYQNPSQAALITMLNPQRTMSCSLRPSPHQNPPYCPVPALYFPKQPLPPSQTRPQTRSIKPKPPCTFVPLSLPFTHITGRLLNIPSRSRVHNASLHSPTKVPSEQQPISLPSLFSLAPSQALSSLTSAEGASTLFQLPFKIYLILIYFIYYPPLFNPYDAN